MGISVKGNTAQSVKDAATGAKAVVDAKVGGGNEIALHVKAELDAGSTVIVQPEPTSGRYYEFFKNGGSNDMQVDGSVTPVVFSAPINATVSVRIDQIRIFGGGSGIKFDKFLSQNSALSNGLLVEWKESDTVGSYPGLIKTAAFKNLFAYPSGANFVLDYAQSGDQMIAIHEFKSPLILKKTGTYSPDDFLRITIQDDLSSQLSSLKALAIGRLE